MSKVIQTVEELDAVLHWRRKHAQAMRAVDAGKDREAALQQRLTAADERADRLECEVGRLKKISDNYCSLLMDANSRLSVADLAVGAIKSWTEETRESVLESFQAELNDSASYEWYDNAISDLMKIVSALKPTEADKCAHSYHHFGDYPRRRCNKCNKLEPMSAEQVAQFNDDNDHRPGRED